MAVTNLWAVCKTITCVSAFTEKAFLEIVEAAAGMDTLCVAIDSNTCCACFGNYEDDFGTGRERLQCCCSRWIREECVEQYRRPPQISTYACWDNRRDFALKN